jgi:hypothetical protein
MTQEKEQKDLMLRNEDKLLLLCARTQINNGIKNQIISIIQQEIDWDYLLKKSYKHKLTSLLYWQLNNICPDSPPENVMEHLKTFFHENAHKNLLFMGELLRILELFKSHGITGIPYKGPVLAIQTYGNLAFREFDDLDIYVNKKDVVRAKKILLSEGYQTKFSLKDNQEEKYLKSQREYKFTNPHYNINLEIQWKFPVLSYTFPIHSDFCGQLIKKSISGHKIVGPNNENMLLILCIHNAGHFWSRISWICDIAEFITANEICWEKIIEKTAELRIERILFLNLLLARDFLGINIPNQISSKFESDSTLEKIIDTIKKRIFLNSPEVPNTLQDIILRLVIRENNIDRIKDFFRLIIKPLEN